MCVPVGAWLSRMLRMIETQVDLSMAKPHSHFPLVISFLLSLHWVPSGLICPLYGLVIELTNPSGLGLPVA